MFHLRGRASDIVVDVSTGCPTVVHWGAPLPSGIELEPATMLTDPIVHGTPDVVAPVSVVPEHGSAYPGRPGLLGLPPDADGDWSPRFSPGSYEHAGNTLAVRAVDAVAGLVLDVSFDARLGADRAAPR